VALTQIIDDTYYVAGNTSLICLAITGASAMDAFTAPTVPLKCLFGIGCVCGATSGAFF